MSEATVIRCCAPTLADIKTGSIFNCVFTDRQDMAESLRRINRCLIKSGACAIPLMYREGKALIYLFRPMMLKRDLNDPVASGILEVCGYPEGKPEKRIAFLIRRLKEYDVFPHEIGLFLGYPAVDVRGFMEHRKCKYTGLWKVFESDETEAKKIFACCRNCTQAYIRRNQQGWSLSRLTLAPRQFSYNKSQKEKGI